MTSVCWAETRSRSVTSRQCSAAPGKRNAESSIEASGRFKGPAIAIKAIHGYAADRRPATADKAQPSRGEPIVEPADAPPMRAPRRFLRRTGVPGLEDTSG